MTADFGAVKRLTDRWGEHLARGRTIEVATARGTALRAEIGGWDRLPLLDGGPLPRDTAGGLGNFPAGEAAISPIEGTASGSIVVDLTISTTPRPLSNEIELVVEGGVVVSVRGDAEARALEDFLDHAGESARVVAEIALGTNGAALHSGVILEDEKKLGTAHVGLGNATGFGGENVSPVHIDGVFADASVSVDGIPLLRDGAVTNAGSARERLDDMPGRGGRFALGRATYEVAGGRAHALWADVRGFPVRSQIGDAAAARLGAKTDPHSLLDVRSGTRAARLADLFALYGVLVPEGVDVVSAPALAGAEKGSGWK